MIGQYGSADWGIIPRSVCALVIAINRKQVGKELLASVADENPG